MTDTEKLERIVALCKGEVSLTANAHRTYYETVRERFAHTPRTWFAHMEARHADHVGRLVDSVAYHGERQRSTWEVWGKLPIRLVSREEAEAMFPRKR